MLVLEYYYFIGVGFLTSTGALQNHAARKYNLPIDSRRWCADPWTLHGYHEVGR